MDPMAEASRIVRNEAARLALLEFADHIVAVYEEFTAAGVPPQWGFQAAQNLVITAAEWGIADDA